MKKSRFFIHLILLIFLGFSTTSCKIVKNVEDITENANEILEQLASLSRTITSKVETGELEESLGNLVDDRIQNLSKTIEDLLINGGGFLFDEVNGTLNNTFDNLGGLVDDIKTGILDESVPAIITQLSGELMVHSNALRTHAEDLINLTFGNTSIIISQATDALLTTIAWVIMGVGLLLIIVFLIIFGSKMSKGIQTLVIVLISIFLAAPLSFLFIPPVKGFVLKSLNVGEQFEARGITPKLIAASPTEYEIGTNDKLTVFGIHLEQLNIDSIEVGLYQSGSRKVNFSKSSIKVITANKIILSDFDKSNLNWKPISFKEFNSSYQNMTRTALPTVKYNNYIKNIYTDRIKHKIEIFNRPVGNLTPISSPVNRPVLSPATTATLSNPLKVNTDRLMLDRFKIKEGDYELRISRKGSGEIVQAVQHVRISYPPPPPPKPDVYPIQISWENGKPTKGERAKIRVRLGVLEGQEAKKNITLNLSSNPAIGGLGNINVNRTALNNVGNGILTLTSRQLTVNRAGNHNIRLRADSQNRIAESNEGNNEKNQNLRVGDYKFTATVRFSTFTSHQNMDDPFIGSDTDEYRIDLNTSVTGKSEWKINYNKDGEPGNNYSINQSRTFNSLNEGDKIRIYVSGREADSGFNGGDDQMGNASTTVTIRNDENRTVPILLKADKFTIRGEVVYSKVRIN